MIGEGVLLKGPPVSVLGVFDGLNSDIDRPYGESRKFRYVAAPSHEGIGEFVGPLLTNPPGCPLFGNKFADEPGVKGCYSSFALIPRYVALGIVNSGLRKVTLCLSDGRHTKKLFVKWVYKQSPKALNLVFECCG